MPRRRRAKGNDGILGLVIVVIFLLAAIPKDAWITIGILAAITVVIWLAIPALKAPATPIERPTVPPQIRIRVERSAFGRNDEGLRSLLKGPKVPPRWIPAGEPLQVAGITIPGGMLYLGSDLPSLSGAGEPALIEPRLPVSRSPVDSSFRRMGYWPSYSTADPESRRAYLDWLATGRRDPKADIGYVFLFFYGLERRALVDAATDPAALADLGPIEDEIRRLLTIYTENRSFRGYAGRFLEYLQAKHSPAQLDEGPPPRAERREMPLAMRVGLGRMAASGRRVPADWAFAWMNVDSTISRPKLLQRCPLEFEQLFVTRYKAQFGEGLELPRNRTKLRVTYLPASGGFGGREYPIDFGDTPDITAVVAPIKKMQSIVDDCAATLAPYSRFRGKVTESGSSFERVLLLPLPLWPETAQSVVRDLNNRVGDEPVLSTLTALSSSLGCSVVLERESVRALARALQAAQIGMEPDVLSGVRIPKPEDPIVLFRNESPLGHSEPAPAYHAASAMLDLGCAVAMADGSASAGEVQLLTRQIEGWPNLGTGHHTRLKARMRRGLALPPSLSSLKKRFEEIPVDARRAIAHLMSTLAQVDGAVAPTEVQLLEKTYKALGFDAQTAYGDLHAAASGTRASGGVPSASAPATPSKRQDGFTLDPSRIEALQKETDQVSALLATVFVDEVAASVAEVEEPDEVAPIGSARLLGLDAEHTAFLRLLISRPSWSRQELSDAAADMELMLDGALERINEAALDNLNLPLIEGDDPIEVSRSALEAMPE